MIAVWGLFVVVESRSTGQGFGSFGSWRPRSLAKNSSLGIRGLNSPTFCAGMHAGVQDQLSGECLTFFASSSMSGLHDDFNITLEPLRLTPPGG